MASLKSMIEYCDQLLKIGKWKDYCPNGLQVEGRAEVGRIITGVTACQALLDQAVADHADLILVHHGYFWRGEDPCITGIKRRRLHTLLQHDVSLLAYHLPLDAHPELGNNAQLAQRLGIEVEGPLNKEGIGQYGYLQTAQSIDDFSLQIRQKLGRVPVVIRGGEQPIRTIAWCTGGAQGYIDQAVELGVDAYLSGEISEQTVHIAREQGIHYFAAGHHATERYGVQALGEHLAGVFQLEHRYIEIDNPV